MDLIKYIVYLFETIKKLCYHFVSRKRGEKEEGRGGRMGGREERRRERREGREEREGREGGGGESFPK